MFIRPSKYKNKKIIIDGIKFDSLAEGEYYTILKSSKTIKLLELQPKVYLTKSRILYKPDFLIEEDGRKVYIDVKGFETPVFKIKKRLWKHYGVGILRLVEKKYKLFQLKEEIECITK